MQKKIDPKTLKRVILSALFETAIAVILVAIDLITKQAAFANISNDNPVSLLGGFVLLTTVKNTGASFGIFGGSTLALGIVSLVCSILIYAFMVYTSQTRTPLLRASLVLILAGAMGNMVDRFALNYVRDFIKFSPFPWVFNGADSFLTIGVVLLIIYVIFFYTRDKERLDKKKAAKPTAEGLRQGDAEEEGVTTEIEVTASVETASVPTAMAVLPIVETADMTNAEILDTEITKAEISPKAAEVEETLRIRTSTAETTKTAEPAKVKTVEVPKANTIATPKTKTADAAKAKTAAQAAPKKSVKKAE